MTRKRIFIGSSSEALRRKTANGLSLVEIVANALSDEFDIVRWWVDAFEAGDITINKLVDLSRSVDGALLFFLEDDKLESRGVMQLAPRDNVVLEFGLFASRLDVDRALVVLEPGARVPSDLQGLSCEIAHHDPSTTASRLRALFSKRFASDDADHYRGTVDVLRLRVEPKTIEDKMRRPPPHDWLQRSWYSDPAGARAMFAAVDQSGNLGDSARRTRLRGALIRLLDGVIANTVVSFGCGNGDLDFTILSRLNRDGQRVTYIPVDLNEAMLLRALNRNADVARFSRAILADFESSAGFIRRHIRGLKRPPVLFSVPDNRLGNLDTDEAVFLANLRPLLEKEDRLLLDMDVKGPNWTFGADYKAQHAAYPAGLRKMIAHAIAQRTDEPVDAIVARFDSRIGFQHEVNESPVHADAVVVFDRNNDQRLAVTRRYEAPGIVEWVTKQRFKVLRQEAVPLDEHGLLTRVMLLVEV